MSVVAAPQTLLPQARRVVARGTARIEGLPVRRVLATFIAVEWLAVLGTALVVRHAGWIYYQGGDQLWLYTSGWLLGHGQLTQTQVGYAWPVLFAPLSRIVGSNLVPALPFVVLLNVVVLLPTAMLALYGIANRIGGRLFGYWTMLLWIAVPFIGVLYTNTGYHQKYTELTLPQSFGLTAMADMPTMVAGLVAAYFCTKVLFDRTPQLVDAATSGVAAGIAIAIKPATALLLVGPALALLYKRRFVPMLVIGAGIAPAVIALAVWKDRGLGSLPVISGALPHEQLHGLAAAAPVAAISFGKYTHNLDWSVFLRNLALLQEHFWSGRLIEWLVLGGLIGLARRSVTAALLVGGWFFSFAIVKGAFIGASIQDASLLRLMIPAFPAFVLLLASLPYLVPGVPKWGKVRKRERPDGGPSVRTKWILLAATVALTAVLPAAAFAVAHTSGSLEATTIGPLGAPIPVNVDLRTTATVRGRSVRLSWQGASSRGGPVFYRIWRGRTDGLSCPVVPGGRLCQLTLPEVGTTHATSFLDRPPSGRWVYRVAVAANWLNDPGFGDPYEVGRPVTVNVP